MSGGDAAARDGGGLEEEADGRLWVHETDEGDRARFVLGMRGERSERGERTLCCVGVNPSTARPGELDPTSRSVARLAAAHGFDGWRLFNLYAQRATDPGRLHKRMNRGLHARNLACLERELGELEEPVVWAAWGTLIESRPWLVDCLGDLARVVERCGGRWVAMGTLTQAGHPRHPLYLRGDSAMVAFKPVRAGMAEQARAALREVANADDAVFLQRYFKTGPGEYAEGDTFLGVRVPQTRRIARRFKGMAQAERLELVRSPWHEERLLGLLLMVEAYRAGDEGERERIYQDYLDHTAWVNNWDLVDVTAHHIVGAHLWGQGLAPLRELAGSQSLWERRIAVVATWHFIRQGEHGPTLELAAGLLRDPEDLMHKAVGWMLREVGKRDLEAEEGFLQVHYQAMPRTMLRYAIERFPEERRQAYLKGRV